MKKKIHIAHDFTRCTWSFMPSLHNNIPNPYTYFKCTPFKRRERVKKKFEFEYTFDHLPHGVCACYCVHIFHNSFSLRPFPFFFHPSLTPMQWWTHQNEWRWNTVSLCVSSIFWSGDDIIGKLCICVIRALKVKKNILFSQVFRIAICIKIAKRVVAAAKKNVIQLNSGENRTRALRFTVELRRNFLRKRNSMRNGCGI